MIYSVLVEFHKDFVKIEDNTIIVGIKSKPIKGIANKEIVKKLSAHFKISSSQVVIKSGHKSKTKIVEIFN